MCIVHFPCVVDAVQNTLHFHKQQHCKNVQRRVPGRGSSIRRQLHAIQQQWCSSSNNVCIDQYQHAAATTAAAAVGHVRSPRATRCMGTRLRKQNVSMHRAEGGKLLLCSVFVRNCVQQPICKLPQQQHRNNQTNNNSGWWSNGIC